MAEDVPECKGVVRKVAISITELTAAVYGPPLVNSFVESFEGHFVHLAFVPPADLYDRDDQLRVTHLIDKAVSDPPQFNLVAVFHPGQPCALHPRLLQPLFELFRKDGADMSPSFFASCLKTNLKVINLHLDFRLIFPLPDH